MKIIQPPACFQANALPNKEMVCSTYLIYCIMFQDNSCRDSKTLYMYQGQHLCSKKAATLEILSLSTCFQANSLLDKPAVSNIFRS